MRAGRAGPGGEPGAGDYRSEGGDSCGVGVWRRRGGYCGCWPGKGHEDYQEIKGVKHHFDDKEVIKEIFKL